MSINFTSADQPSPELPESDTPLFAPNPIWERSSKKKRFGGSRRATPGASVGPVATDPRTAPMTEGEPMAAAPYTRTTTTRRKDSGVPGVAIAAGVIVLGGLAAAGWYATQPHGNGVAQLTPGAPGAGALAPSTDTTTVAANTPPPAAATPAAAPAPRTVTTTTRTTTHVAAATPRVRPASRAPSASTSGVNASASAALPDAPQPYSGAATAPAPAATTTPAPAQSLPATPPVEPAPAPSASSPATPPATPAPGSAAPPQAAATPQ